jgi:hypothetical protein
MQMMQLLLRTLVLAWLTAGSCQAFYNPETGRWLSRDPIGERGGPNLQVQVQNDPIGKIDALGKVKWDDSSPGEAENLDGCLDACDELCFRFGPFNNFTSCYCYCWKKFPPTPRGKSQAMLIAEWQKLHPYVSWPTCSDGKPAEAHHTRPLADGGADDGSNIQPMCADAHRNRHKGNGDYIRWGKRKGRTCKKSDPLDQE